MIVKIDEYTCCMSQICPFRRECAQHGSAGDYRLEDGFTPEIVKAGESHANCETYSQPVLDLEYREFLPANYEKLNRGFVQLK